LRLNADGRADEALAADLSASDLDWPHLLRLADEEHVTAALTVSLRRRGLFDELPRTVRDALHRRYLMGHEINTRIKRQAEEAIGLLNAVGITPMMLKGGLYLFEAPPEALGGRVLRDLDMVIPNDALETCVAVLRDAGYVPEGEHDSWTYQYRPLHHKDKIVPIELHIRPGEQRHLITIEEAWEQTVPVEAGGLRMVALAPAHRVMHNIFHSEVQDAGFVLGAVCLRQLIDLATTCARFSDTLDWRSIERRMEQYGMGGLLRARMHLAVELLGAPIPPIAVDGLRSRLHLRHCLRQQRSPRMAYLARWIAGVAGPLKRHHLDLIYGCGTSGFRLHSHRVKHIAKLLLKYRSGIWNKMTKSGRSLQ